MGSHRPSDVTQYREPEFISERMSTLLARLCRLADVFARSFLLVVEEGRRARGESQGRLVRCARAHADAGVGCAPRRGSERVRSREGRGLADPERSVLFSTTIRTLLALFFMKHPRKAFSGALR